MNLSKIDIKEFEKHNYFATKDLVDVINAAMFLHKPLLIEGPAGTGKTYLAKTLFKLSFLRNALKSEYFFALSSEIEFTLFNITFVSISTDG